MRLASKSQFVLLLLWLVAGVFIKPIPADVLREPGSIQNKRCDQLMEQTLGAALVRQNWMDQYLANRQWRLDLNRQAIIINQSLTLPVVLAGSFSKQTKTWLWAWANSAKTIPRSFKNRARTLHQQVVGHPCRWLNQAYSNLMPQQIRNRLMLASSLYGQGAYIRFNYRDGIAYFLILQMPAQWKETINGLVLEKSVLQLAGCDVVNIKQALHDLFKYFDKKVVSSSRSIKVAWSRRLNLVFKFNKKSGLVQVRRIYRAISTHK